MPLTLKAENPHQMQINKIEVAGLFELIKANTSITIITHLHDGIWHFSATVSPKVYCKLMVCNASQEEEESKILWYVEDKEGRKRVIFSTTIFHYYTLFAFGKLSAWTPYSIEYFFKVNRIVPGIIKREPIIWA